MVGGAAVGSEGDETETGYLAIEGGRDTIGVGPCTGLGGEGLVSNGGERDLE